MYYLYVFFSSFSYVPIFSLSENLVENFQTVKENFKTKTKVFFKNKKLFKKKKKKMRILSLFVAAVCTIFLIFSVAGLSSAQELSEQDIRCKVCEKAIEYVWNQGYELRNHCKRDDRHDPRCDYYQIHRFGIDELVHEVCDKLPTTHHRTKSESFDLTFNAAEKPDHSHEDAKTIRNTCLKWVHQEHGMEQVALYIYANLDAGKHTDTILRGLQDRYCKKRACNPNFVQSHNVENAHYPDAHFHSASKSKSTQDL